MAPGLSIISSSGVEWAGRYSLRTLIKKTFWIVLVALLSIQKPTVFSAIDPQPVDYNDSQVPVPARRPSGGSDNRLYVDPQYPEVYPPMEDLHGLII